MCHGGHLHKEMIRDILLLDRSMRLALLLLFDLSDETCLNFQMRSSIVVIHP